MNEAARCGLRLAAVMIGLTSMLGLVGPRSAAAGDFEESRSPWAVAPPIGSNEIPGVQRDGTLRVIRFSNDRQVLNDPGTVVGFTSILARTGELPATHEELSDEKSLLEIMRRSEVEKVEKAEPAE